MFKELKKDSYENIEKEQIKKWDEINILQKSIDQGKDYFVFYDGPAFANGFPGLHHMVAKNLKDAFCKYHVMQGKKVLRKVGWDTHGLPIENHVEKKLGFNSKKDIENFGIENFNEECRKSVRENEDAFIRLTHQMGQFIDTENPYLTFKNEYIETEWWILKKFFEKGYFYEGNLVMPYCPHCGTGLASHEVAQGYEEDNADTLYVPFKLKNEDIYLLAWTTTPWTLLANVGLCVNESYDYSIVLFENTKFIVATDLVQSVFKENYEILDTFKGKELEYKEYEQLIKEIDVKEKAFFITCDSYVTKEDGTGIVHLAPAFGVDDNNVCKKYNLPIINPVGKDGCYTEGPWKEKFVFSCTEEIIKYLKENNKVFRKQRIKHQYPHCWRCHTPLIYYAMPSYYIAVSKFKDELLKSNKKVNWYPSYVGEKRFNNWLSNAKDWNVSRTRYWGAPIPYYKCSCGYNHMVGSIDELKKMATCDIPANFDLHKPYIDNVYLKCPKCNGNMKRIPDVLDCWFDSGSMPFAQYHYPFENKELFDKQFPADFICEGIDQTRGWFYTLLVISTFIKGCAPFKNVLVNDLLLDKEGKKMSKSRGNIVEPFETIKKYGADTVRFYLPYVSPVWTPLKFDMDGLKEVYSKFFNPLKNTYTFFETYANIDNIDPKNYNIPYESYEQIDKWLISKYNSLLKYVTLSYDEYDLNKVVKGLTNFVSEDLSNWYIRRNRDRFWGNSLDNSKKCVYKVTYDVLVGISQMLSPISPYLSEEIYTNLTNNLSVHLSNFPKFDEKLIDKELEEKMDLVRKLISMGRSVREEAKIKVRQPISEVIIDGKNKEKLIELENLIKEELNVKNIIYADDLSIYMNYTFKPNYKEVGKILGSKINEFKTYLASLKQDDIEKILNNESIMFNDIEIKKNYIDIIINSKEGFNVFSDGNDFIILNISLNDDLIKEGIARELVSKIQNMRKEKDFEIENRITIYYNTSDKLLLDVIDEYEDYIRKETLAIDIIKNVNLDNCFNINDHKVYLDVLKK